MSYRDALYALDGALRQLIEGQIGTIRKVPHGAFKSGHFIGEPLEKQQHIAADVTYGRNWFDVEVMEDRDDPSTAQSADSNRLVRQLEIRIAFIRYVLSRVDDETKRDNVLAFRADLHDVSQALGKPGNLSFDLHDDPTNIASGCLSQREMPRVGRIDRDWDNHLLSTSMTVVAIVEVVQLVA